jgi:hypothetical protein
MPVVPPLVNGVLYAFEVNLSAIVSRHCDVRSMSVCQCLPVVFVLYCGLATADPAYVIFFMYAQHNSQNMQRALFLTL